MTRSANILLATLLLVLLAGCGEPVPSGRMSYVGEWKGQDMRLVIAASGSVDYVRTRPNGKTTINAPIKKWEGHDFHVGVGFLTTRFVVSRPPSEREGVWTMVVDGVELRRVGGAGDQTWTSFGETLGVSANEGRVMQ